MLYQIHRYPADLIDILELERDGERRRVVVRPVLPQDEALTGAFFAQLSAAARRDRFLSPLREVPGPLIRRFTQVDYSNHVALVAEVFEEAAEKVVAEARYVRSGTGESAEFAVAVAEDWQGLGLARRLLRTLVCHAGRAGVTRLEGETLASNAAMLHLARVAGFTLRPDPEVRGLVRLDMTLRDMEARPLFPCGAAGAFATAAA